MNKFENVSTTNVCVKRNALKRELYLNGESNSDTHNKRLQRQIDEHQAEIDRRERESRDEEVLVLGKEMTTIEMERPEDEGKFLVHPFSWPGGRR